MSNVLSDFCKYCSKEIAKNQVFCMKFQSVLKHKDPLTSQQNFPTPVRLTVAMPCICIGVIPPAKNVAR